MGADTLREADHPASPPFSPNAQATQLSRKPIAEPSADCRVLRGAQGYAGTEARLTKTHRALAREAVRRNTVHS